MYKLYSNTIDIIDVNNEFISFHVKTAEMIFKIFFNDLIDDEAKFLAEIDIQDQLLFNYELQNEYLYIYSLDEKIYILKEKRNNTFFSDKSNKYDVNINNFIKTVSVERIGLDRFILKGDNIDPIEINNLLTNEIINENHDLYMDCEGINKRFVLISLIKYNVYHIAITYDQINQEVNIRKVLFDILECNNNLEISLLDRNKIAIRDCYSNKIKKVNFNLLKRNGSRKLFGKKFVERYKNENILSIIIINKRRYYIYLKRTGIYIRKSNALAVTQHKANLKTFAVRNHIYIFGRLTHNAYNSEQKYDYLYIRNSNHRIGKFRRPFPNTKFLKRFGYFKIALNDLNIDGRIHNNLFLGNEERLIHNLLFKIRDKKVKTYLYKRNGDYLHVIRTNLQSNIASTIIPFTPEYSLTSKLKINVAKYFASFFKNKKKNINLFFEKKSDKADESAIRVFEQIKKQNYSNSKNYFILNGNSKQYKKLKELYGSSIIKKYSLRHFLAIFNADYFISSELSNHVLNDRLYIDSLRDKIMAVPLIFLQHGIMFAKPVDNPMAFGFHKDKNLYNIYKSVISSELEAGEFYKMKYDREDLILTGLPTFDNATLDENADKIAFMPTYRYWEEGLIYNNKIEETTYYASIMRIIKKFEEENLLHRLLIVPHNKFSQYIYKNMAEYKENICDNPSEALRISKIFITDYSSAIYDAQYRGAYPIFYWEEKDYLIRQYKAIPPVNDENAPGPIAYSLVELIKEVKKAIDQKYQLEDEFKKKYLKINSFNDNRNTQRVIKFLQDEQII
ncbi:CDP-glycerol glycerophosphotransferase family protein [Bacillus haynesii]|uniref:CDP-glycerol glycerophosphotransferase family protein n=1 Tax=Bacillus haynesii TaxID=1925021 RepID=UPI0035D54643